MAFILPPPSGDDEGLSRSAEERSVSPSDPVEYLNAFTRKVGAFVNKPSTQVSPRSRRTPPSGFFSVLKRRCLQITAANLDLPFAAFAARGLDSEGSDPMVTAAQPHKPPPPSTASLMLVFVGAGSAPGVPPQPVPPAGQPSLSGLRGIRAAGRLRHGGLCEFRPPFQSQTSHSGVFYCCVCAAACCSFSGSRGHSDSYLPVEAPPISIFSTGITFPSEKILKM